MVGLSQAEAADHLATRHRRQQTLSLILRPPPVDREHRERALHRDERPQTRVDRLQLETRESVGDGRQPGAAIPVEMHAEDTELTELPGHRAHVPDEAVLEPLRHVRQQAVLAVATYGGTQVELVGREQLVDCREAPQLPGCVRARRVSGHLVGAHAVGTPIVRGLRTRSQAALTIWSSVTSTRSAAGPRGTKLSRLLRRATGPS